MITMEAYMKNIGVKNKSTVEKWVEAGLIPGVQTDQKTNELLFPDSARKPFSPRVNEKSDANAIYASMVCACINRRHISPQIYPFLSKGEFYNMIDELVEVRLISRRMEDGIEYYDATTQSSEYKNRKTKEIQKFVKECLEVVTKASVKAVMEVAMSAPKEA